MLMMGGHFVEVKSRSVKRQQVASKQRSITTMFKCNSISITPVVVFLILDNLYDTTCPSILITFKMLEISYGQLP